jgi:hypothetical protein
MYGGTAYPTRAAGGKAGGEASAGAASQERTAGQVKVAGNDNPPRRPELGGSEGNVLGGQRSVQSQACAASARRLRERTAAAAAAFESESVPGT